MQGGLLAGTLKGTHEGAIQRSLETLKTMLEQ
jgi:hypothetical protein